MRVCVVIFFRRRFLSFTFCPLPSPLPRGEGTACRKSDNGRFLAPSFSLRGRGADCRKSDNGRFSTIIPSPCGRGLGRGQNPRIRVSFFLMANLPVSFSQTMCVRFSGEGSSETYLAAVVVYVFLLVVWVMRIFCCHLFRRRFLKVIGFCPLPNPLPRGEGTDCRKSNNGRF